MQGVPTYRRSGRKSPLRPAASPGSASVAPDEACTTIGLHNEMEEPPVQGHMATRRRYTVRTGRPADRPGQHRKCSGGTRAGDPGALYEEFHSIGIRALGPNDRGRGLSVAKMFGLASLTGAARAALVNKNNSEVRLVSGPCSVCARSIAGSALACLDPGRS
jgi:hypothetical protein